MTAVTRRVARARKLTLPTERFLGCDERNRCVPSSERHPIGPGVCQPYGPLQQRPCEFDWQCNGECVDGYRDPREHAFCITPY